MIDSKGFRSGVVMVITNGQQRVLWAKRVGQDAWQFPQGGMQEGETPEQAMYRELKEEVGLDPADVEIIAETEDWLSYRLPKKLIRPHSLPLCLGQKQKWFLLQLVGNEEHICFDATSTPEFDDWRWVNYWYPLKEVINFKHNVYHRAIKFFESFVFKK